MEKNIYDLKLHESTKIGESSRIQGFTIVKRVPGGWIYSIPNPEEKTRTGTFVPYSEEFKDK